MLSDESHSLKHENVLGPLLLSLTEHINAVSEYLLSEYLLKIYIFYFSKEKGKGKKGREIAMCGCFPCIPHWGPGPQPRHVP